MENICEFCNEKYEWDKIKIHKIEGKKLGYNAQRFCSWECGQKNNLKRRELTSLQKYGVKNISELESTKIKKQKTCLKNHGVLYPMQSEKVQQTLKNNCMNKYGVDSIAKVDLVKNAKKQTNIERYGASTFIHSEKGKLSVKQTNIERYGVENAFQSEEIKNKIKQTNLERYRVEYPSQSVSIQKKIKQTVKEKWGVSNISQTTYWQENVSKTKRKNKTHAKSIPEDQLYNDLVQYFSEENIIRQYRAEEYPGECDFYIVPLKLWIEFQGTWEHGKEPFDNTNKNHIEICEKWQAKSQEVNWKGNKKYRYERALYCWTTSDPKKRQWAVENNKNWIEFFTYENFVKWYKEVLINEK